MEQYNFKPAWKRAFKGATHLLQLHRNKYYVFAFYRCEDFYHSKKSGSLSYNEFTVIESNPNKTLHLTVGDGVTDDNDLSCIEVTPMPLPTSDDTGNRFNQDKSPLSIMLEAKHAIEGCSEILKFGAEKYARGNWRKGLNHTEICDSLLRHMSSYLAGEDNDPESNLPHVDHILCNALFLSEMTRTHADLDDRSVIKS